MCIEIGMRFQFREKLWISEDTFGYIPNIICQFIQKTLTDLIQLPVEPEWQLALTI